MHKYKQYTRLFVFSIIAFIFLFPNIRARVRVRGTHAHNR